MSKVHLYYWGMPGKGQPIRLLLEYLGLPYEETRYTPQTAMDWFAKDKQNVGFDFPNLPSIVDGDKKLAENVVITSYLPFKAGKTELNGKGEDQFKVEEVKNVVSDTIFQVYLSSLEKEKDAQLKIFKEKIQPKIQYLQKFYRGKEWGVGYLTVADFYVYSVLSHTKQIFENEFQTEFTDFLPFLQRFEAIPQIKKYQNSDRYIPYKN